MLKRLSISQFVIIDALSIEFSEGLTTLTGETGAGKSILLDAMGLILGDDPDREAIRQGANESVFEAVFEQSPDHPVWAFLAGLAGCEASPPMLKIHRVFDRASKDTISVNGRVIDLPTARELGAQLVEIHGQNANQNFLAPETQLSLLDAYGDYPPTLMSDVARAWHDVARYTQEMEEERKFFAIAEREKTGIQNFITKADKIGLKSGFCDKLKSDLAHLIQVRDICDAFQGANAQLVAQFGAELALSRVDRTLSGHADPALEPMKEAVRAALVQTKIAVKEMERLAPKYLYVDTSGIDKMEKAVAELEALASENKVPVAELENYYEKMAARLSRIIGAPTKIKELDAKAAEASNAYHALGQTLTEERRKAAGTLSASINAEMPLLKMKSAEARVDVTENITKRTERGYNEVTFMARMNPGMPFSAITKTASGGEMSRLILALKVILQDVQTVSTLVFDEIDSGIGGAEASAVGNRIAKLASGVQVLVVTHSPQVASSGSTHLHVSKKIAGSVTTSIVNPLTLEQRIDEISRMLAGEQTTDESHAAAKTLIEESARAREAFRVAREAQRVS